MRRLLVTLVLCLSAVSFAQGEAPAAAEGPKPKLTLVPFASLSSEVPTRTGAKAMGMLAREFKSAESYVVVDVKRANASDAFAEALAQAKKHVEEAEGLRAKKKFRLADEALRKALKIYADNAAGVTEVAEVADAYALLSAVQFNTGRDDDGQKSLNAALALSGSRELPLVATSPLFGRLVADTKKAIAAGPKATLVVESTPANAPVVLDGMPLGATPLQVSDVPPGLHAWRATLPNGELVGGMVEVVGGKTTKVTAAASNKDPEAKLLSSLAQNRIDADALAAAKEAGKAAEAEWVLFGALVKSGKGITLNSFLLTKAGEVRRLPLATFDPELLSAGMEFYNLAGEVAKKGAQVGDPVKVPNAVATDGVGLGTPKLAEAKYGVVPGVIDAVDSPDAPSKEGPKKPLGPRVPLKKK